MKLLGAGLLWTSLIYLGVTYSIKAKKRVEILEKTLLMIEEMKILLQYLNMPLSEMFKSLDNKAHLKDLDFIGKCVSAMENGSDFPIAWKNSVFSTSVLYKTQEKERLLQLGLNLGAGDIESQLKILNVYSVYFQGFLEKAKQECKKNSSTSAVLGFLSGFMIFILLI